MRIPNYESIIGSASRHNIIRCWVIDHVVCLGEERRRAATLCIMDPIHRPRSMPLAVTADCGLSTLTEFIIPYVVHAAPSRQIKRASHLSKKQKYVPNIGTPLCSGTRNGLSNVCAHRLPLANCQAPETTGHGSGATKARRVWAQEQGAGK